MRRKRAKTEDEKEQRRVERVLRNRRAAQSSRERKRLETEALASRNKDLETALLALTSQVQALQKELKKVKPELGGISTSSDSLVTLSQPLFSFPAQPPPHSMADADKSPQEDIPPMSQPTLDLINDLVKAQRGVDVTTQNTVNPASLSPALTPVPEEPESEPASVELEPKVSQPVETAAIEGVVTSTTRATQYSAAVLCDLQCQRLMEMTTLSFSAISVIFQLQTWVLHFLWTTSSTFLSCLTSLLQRRSRLISIIRLVTNQRASTSSPPATTSSPTRPTPTTSDSCKPLRLRLLRRFLTSNRQLARPLLDATLEVLRWNQTRSPDKRSQLFAGQSIDGGLPSSERLIALAHAIQKMERRIEKRRQIAKISSTAPAASLGPAEDWSSCRQAGTES